MFNDGDYIPWLICLVFLATEPLLQVAILQMCNDGDYLGLFVLFSLPQTPSAAGFKCNDGDYLGFLTFFSLSPNPFCSLLSFKCYDNEVLGFFAIFSLLPNPFSSWL
jgi:hypothetical protein